MFIYVKTVTCNDVYLKEKKKGGEKKKKNNNNKAVGNLDTVRTNLCFLNVLHLFFSLLFWSVQSTDRRKG